MPNGDIAVFKLPKDNSTDYIKRVIGLPGDHIQVLNGVLHINGAPVKRERVEDYRTTDLFGRMQSVPTYRETLPNGVSYRTIERDGDRGYWVMRRLAHLCPQLRVIVLSNFGWGAMRDGFLQGGASAYFDKAFEFRGPMPLGFRQLEADWWPATRLYYIDYQSPEAARRLHQQTPLKVTLKRAGKQQKGHGADDEYIDNPNLLINKILNRDDASVPNANSLKLKLQTISQSQGYWLDTGILLEN